MKRGGKREMAGSISEPTRPVRIPESQIERGCVFVREREYALPLYGNLVPAGFPAPADDYGGSGS